MQSQDIDTILKKAFDYFDYEKNETVNPKMLASSFIEWKFVEKYPYIFQIICNLDQDNMQGGISYDQFKGVILDSLGDRQSEENVHRMFNLLDLKRNDKLDKADLKELFNQAGVKSSDEEIDKMILLLASDGERISRQDFLRLEHTLHDIPKS